MQNKKGNHLHGKHDKHLEMDWSYNALSTEGSIHEKSVPSGEALTCKISCLQILTQERPQMCSLAVLLAEYRVSCLGGRSECHGSRNSVFLKIEFPAGGVLESSRRAPQRLCCCQLWRKHHHLPNSQWCKYKSKGHLASSLSTHH